VSGVDIGDMRADGAQLFRLVRGKVVQLVGCGDRHRAFADLGLER
jgi:hypothetical protein